MHVDTLIWASIDSTTCGVCLLSLEGAASYNLEHICDFDCKPADNTAQEIRTEMPLAKSTPFLPERAHMLMQQMFAMARRQAC
jgi:hypothetical protein